MTKGHHFPDIEGESRMTAPRLEDAVIDALGGVSGGSFAHASQAKAVPVGEVGAAVIETSELTKKYGSFTSADSISFEVGQGEVFGLLGPNGAGKSTAFKMLCGLLRPTSGEARVAGVDLMTSTSEARSRIGYMAQKFSLYGDLNVRQNLDFFAGIYGLTGKRKREAVGGNLRCSRVLWYRYRCKPD